MEREKKYIWLTFIIAGITGVYTFIVSTMVGGFNNFLSIYDIVWLLSLLILCSVFGYTYRMLVAKNEKKPLILLDLNGFSPQLHLTIDLTKGEAERHKEFLKKSSNGRITGFTVEDLRKDFMQGITVPITFRELVE